MKDLFIKPEVRVGIVAVSRSCFPMEISKRRKNQVVRAAEESGIALVDIGVIVEDEKNVLEALKELRETGCNALVVYLGNFGPEGPETMLIQKFGGPAAVVGAAEESGADLTEGRGDAYCGMLNASYNLGIRNIRAYIPEKPVGLPADIVKHIAEFIDIARVLIGLKGLKIFTFGPRPYDFLACNAPIKPLFDLGVEIQENSELDLYEYYKKHDGDIRIDDIVKDMEKELGEGNNYPGVLSKLAQYELTLLDWAAENAGASAYFAFANKCWPAFQTQFGFVPCYVNSRLMRRGIPVACETDIYGALSEYMAVCATCMPATLLDVNNTVPKDMLQENSDKLDNYSPNDVFMGFHCGNTPSCCLTDYSMQYQLIMKRNLEPDSEPNISRGTIEGNIKPSDITVFRLQGAADGTLSSYMAEGNILDIDCRSFGGIGVIAVNEMERFYRYVLIDGNYPHHTAVAFKHTGKILFETVKLLGVSDIKYNLPAGLPYPGENPFKG